MLTSVPVAEEDECDEDVDMEEPEMLCMCRMMRRTIQMKTQRTAEFYADCVVDSVDILHLHCSGQRLVQDAHPKQSKCRMSN